MTEEDHRDFRIAMRMIKMESTELGMRRLLELAKSGDAHADVAIGLVYERGLAPYAVDFALALEHYERAAINCGAVEALLGVGRISMAGPGELRDYEKAAASYTSASTVDPCPEAWLGLGAIYLNGLGRPVDLERADAAFEKASLQGSFLGFTGRAQVAWKRRQYVRSVRLRIRAIREGLAHTDEE